MAVPMTVATEGAAGGIVPNDFEREVISLTAGTSQVVRAIPSSRRYFLERINDSIPATYNGMEPDWVDELDKKHQDYVQLKAVPLNGKELTLLTAATDRLLENSVASLDTLFGEEAIKGFANKLDKAILGNGTPAVWGSQADLKTAATDASQVVDGADAGITDYGIFFSAILAHLEANDNWDESQTVWFVKRSARQYLRDERTTNGEPLFVPNAIQENGSVGSIYGLPVYWVDAGKFPDDIDVFCVDMSKVAWGVKADAVRFEKSDVAAYTVSGNLVSAFERNETVYKWFGMYAFNIIDITGVAAGDNIADVG